MSFFYFHTSNVTQRYTDLQKITSSAVMDIDISVADCYNGTSVILKNLVNSPADGSVKSAYDLQFGNGSTPSTYPVFVGEVGTPTADLLFDGGGGAGISSGKYLTLVDANTPFINSLHKTTGGSAFTIVMIFELVPDTATTNYLFSTRENLNDVGITGYLSSTETIQFLQRGDSSSNTPQGSLNVPTDTQTYLSIGQQANGGQLSHRANSTSETLITQAFNASISSATTKFQVGKGASTTFRNGTKLKAVSLFNSRLSDSEMLSVMTEYKRRHNFAYSGV